MKIDLQTKAGRKQAYRDLIWGDHGFLRLWFHNQHDIGGDMYRANQPSPRRIEKLAKRGIKTIINLRGESDKGYYLLEKEACERHGITLVDFRMYSRDTPTPEAVNGIREIFETIEYPALMHCKSGADRTGIAGVLYKHFKLGEPIEDAVEQLSLKYLHMKAGKTGMLDYFFDTYLGGPAKDGISFSQWIEGDYDRQKVKDGFMASWLGKILTDKILRRE